MAWRKKEDDDEARLFNESHQRIEYAVRTHSNYSLVATIAVLTLTSFFLDASRSKPVVQCAQRLSTNEKCPMNHHLSTRVKENQIGAQTLGGQQCDLRIDGIMSRPVNRVFVIGVGMTKVQMRRA